MVIVRIKSDANTKEEFYNITDTLDSSIYVYDSYFNDFFNLHNIREVFFNRKD
jgi:hypothetical protein